MSYYTADSRVSVFPFTRRVEGGEVVIGRPDTAVFLALPEAAVHLLDELANGKTVGEARELYRTRYGEDPDVGDLLERLELEGFVWPYGSESPTRRTPVPMRFHFTGIPEVWARRIFSLPVLAVCGVIIAMGMALLFTQPQLLPGWRAYFFTDHITISYALLVLLGYAGVFLHEMAHLTAARALGVSCRLGFGNRLWMLVAETDMTGIWAAEPRKRYLPYLAGPLVDAVSASLLLLASFAARNGMMTLPPLAAALLQAMLLSYLMNLMWQCYFFVRTDFYYVVSNFFGCKNLLGDTATFLRNKLSGLVPRVRYEDQSHIPAHELRVIRVYAWFWLVGRILSLTILVKVTLPLIWSYLVLLFSPSGTGGLRTRLDVLGMALVIVGPQMAGLWLWLRSLRKPQEA